MTDDHRSLAGVRVVVTRAEHQADELTAALEDRGADVAHLPLLAVTPPDDPQPLGRACEEIATFDWIVFTSTNAVEAVYERLEPPSGGRGDDVDVAAIGDATARALRERGVEPTLVASDARGRGLVMALAPRVGRRDRVLLPQAADARPVVREGLEQTGAEVIQVDAYAKRLPDDARARFDRIFGDGPLSWVTFTSPSTARNFRGLVGEEWAERRQSLHAAAIGPTTTHALRRYGVRPAAVAAKPKMAALVEAIVEAVSS